MIPTAIDTSAIIVLKNTVPVERFSYALLPTANAGTALAVGKIPIINADFKRSPSNPTNNAAPRMIAAWTKFFTNTLGAVEHS